MTTSKSQSSTFSRVFSHSQRDADLSKLTSSPNHRHFFSLEWWSMSCWFLEVEFNSQSWTNWLQACRWLQIPVIKVKWTGTGLVSQLNDTCLAQAPLCLWCLVAHIQACVRCMNASTELVCMVCQKVLSRFLMRIAETHRGCMAWCFLLLWTNSLLDAVAS